MELGFKGLYSEEAVAKGVTTGKADLLFASIPFRLMPALQIPLYERIAAQDAALYARLDQAGFLLDWGQDRSGLMMKALRTGSGYYIDVGASDLIAAGEIKVRSGVELRALKERSVLLSNGSELPADLVVFATGFGAMNGWVAQLVRVKRHAAQAPNMDFDEFRQGYRQGHAAWPHWYGGRVRQPRLLPRLPAGLLHLRHSHQCRWRPIALGPASSSDYIKTRRRCTFERTT
jgi:hypothetical protein